MLITSERVSKQSRHLKSCSSSGSKHAQLNEIDQVARSTHSITLPITQREEMYLEDENIGPEAELNISTTRKG